jgi:hypothetical protein
MVDIAPTGAGEAQKVGGLADLLGGIMRDCDGATGAFRDRLDRRLGRDFMDDVAAGQAVGAPRTDLDVVGACRVGNRRDRPSRPVKVGFIWSS